MTSGGSGNRRGARAEKGGPSFDGERSPIGGPLTGRIGLIGRRPQQCRCVAVKMECASTVKDRRDRQRATLFPDFPTGDPLVETIRFAPSRPAGCALRTLSAGTHAVTGNGRYAISALVRGCGEGERASNNSTRDLPTHHSSICHLSQQPVSIFIVVVALLSSGTCLPSYPRARCLWSVFASHTRARAHTRPVSTPAAHLRARVRLSSDERDTLHLLVTSRAIGC